MANSTSHANWFGPIRKSRFTLEVPYLDADGDPTDPTTPDTEVSKDFAAFADCGEEVTTVSGAAGSGYITLTGAEMDCLHVALHAKVVSGPKATRLNFRPKDYPILSTGTATAGAAGTITLVAGSSAIDDYYVGCIIRTTGGTGGGGAGGVDNQARMITDYVGSTRVATIGPANWEVNPNNTTTYDLLKTEWSGAHIAADSSGNVTANVTQWLGTAPATPATAGVPKINVIEWLGGGVAAVNTVGVPVVDLVRVNNSTPVATAIANLLNGTGTAVAITTLAVSSTAAFTGHMSLADGLAVTASTADRNAVILTGNGLGSGLDVSGGATAGQGTKLSGGAGAATSHGVWCSSSGSGVGLYASGGVTGSGLWLRGGFTSGDGARIESRTSGVGLSMAGMGTGSGLVITKGSSATYDMELTTPANSNLSSNVLQVNSNTTSAVRLAALFNNLKEGTVNTATFTPTTTQFECTGIAITADNVLTDKVLQMVFSVDLKLDGHAYVITAHEGTVTNANGKTKLTVAGLPQALASGDKFIIFGTKTP